MAHLQWRSHQQELSTTHLLFLTRMHTSFIHSTFYDITAKAASRCAFQSKQCN